MDRVFKEFRGYHLAFMGDRVNLNCNQCMIPVFTTFSEYELSLADVMENMYIAAFNHTEVKHALQPRV